MQTTGLKKGGLIDRTDDRRVIKTISFRSTNTGAKQAER